MEKKKIMQWLLIACVVLLVVVICALLMLARNIESERDIEQVVSKKTLNENVNLEYVFEEIEKIIETENLETEKLENSENTTQMHPEDLIYFGKHEELERKAIVNTNDEVIQEVWMIKLSDYNQQEEVCRMLGNRIKELKITFKENDEQVDIINQAVIKQEDGIVIMIVSENVKEIEETIRNAMK